MLAAENVSKAFPLPDGSDLNVLSDVSLSIHDGEVVALLGRSGSGKSTLLRILAGLIAPTRGRVLVKDKELVGANSAVAMVFQSFALLPWLTVQENAELGLIARGVDRATCEARPITLSGWWVWKASSPPTRASFRAACASASDSRALS